MKNRKSRNRPLIVSDEPQREKLPWPGLRAKDRLSRVVTRAVKEEREMKETEVWARKQIARVLDHVSPWLVIEVAVGKLNRRL